MKKGTEKIKREKKVRKKIKLGKKGKAILCIVLAIVVAVAGFGIYKWRKAKKTASATDNGTSIVRAGNLTNSISGSGSVEPIDQRDIVPEVNGKIVESPFEEGDEVKAGDVLYRFEMTAATNAIESAENNVQKAQTTLSNRQSSLTKAQENIEKLTIKATSSGKISDLSLRVGEEVSGKICTVTNFKEQTVAIPFSSAHIGSIKVGDTANIAVDKYMINTTGEVVRKYTASDTLSSGAVVYYVEIRLSNDYILEENVNVTATIGSLNSASYGTVKYADPVTVNAEQKGKVSKVNFKNGDWVNEGEVIAVLKNSDLNDELRTAQQNVSEAQMNLTESLNNLEDKQEEANEYIVTSPIDGVILTKDYAAGDTINGQNAPTMMVVADMSKMKFTISADELDISKIKLGQSVSVTADALTGQSLSGRITAISKLGTSSNGVTNYPIEVTIDEPGDLMPGMNVSANIIVEQAYDTLYLPVEAVEYYGGKYYVTIVGEVTNMPERTAMPTGGFRGQTQNNEDSGKTESDKDGQKMPDTSQNPDRGQMPDRANWGERPDGADRSAGSNTESEGQKPDIKTENKNSEKTENNEKDSSSQTNEKSQTSTDKNAGRTDADSGSNKGSFSQGGQKQQEELQIKEYKSEERVEVEVGIITDTYYEIKSGVEYGQVVKNTAQTSSSSQSGFGMMGGMPGGMMGGMGGMSGGMGGGMPSGGGQNRNSGNRNAGGR